MEKAILAKGNSFSYSQLPSGGLSTTISNTDDCTNSNTYGFKTD